VLASLHYRELPENRRRQYLRYDQFSHLYKWEMISIPTKMKEIKEWERVNKVTVNVFNHVRGELYPVHTLKTPHPKMVDLLITNDNKQDPDHHFISITNLSALVGCKYGKSQKTCRSCKFTNFIFVFSFFM